VRRRKCGSSLRRVGVWALFTGDGWDNLGAAGRGVVCADDRAGEEMPRGVVMEGVCIVNLEAGNPGVLNGDDVDWDVVVDTDRAACDTGTDGACLVGLVVVVVVEAICPVSRPPLPDELDTYSGPCGIVGAFPLWRDISNHLDARRPHKHTVSITTCKIRLTLDGAVVLAIWRLKFDAYPFAGGKGCCAGETDDAVAIGGGDAGSCGN